MFYYPNVLQRHTGCFATIWLAATRGSRLVKREYLKVNVVKTCEEILDYVLVRVQPPMPGLPRPRFSLYLSAQLQIGVIRVYSQQCQYLVEDIQHILERLHRAQLQIRIDMVETELPSLLLPNRLAMMETLEDAPDPFFGMMSVDPALPSPFSIPQVRQLLEAVSPERELEEAPPEVPMEPKKPDRVPVTVLSPEAITLQEAEPILMLPIEGERDLPEVSRRDLDLLIAEEDEAILLEERREAEEEPRALERERAVPPLSPPALAPVEEAAEPLPVPAPEEVKPVGWEPEALLAEVTPPPELRLPAPLSPERLRPPVPPAPRSPPARRRRRQLVFWDKETQISREKFQEQLQTRAHCWECPKVQPPERTTRSPMELFRTPTHSGWLPPELLALWTRCAQPPPGALRRRPPPEPEEEAEREVAAEEERISDIEVPREAQEPSGPLMLSAELSLEAAEEEKSRVSLVPPEERWAWAEAEQLEPPALPAVPEVPELPLELPPEPELLSPEAVCRAVAQELQANREPDFGSLVSPVSPRRMAARVFYLLLVLAAQQILRLEQEKPYGRLLILLGPRFHCG
ncbi:meiotic recombination protein REC8 homolog isoform X1 [Zalophus californianus]|uniref:Meiotic recombination protein REC8 homolog isoform X1 n=2 Tax=Zalophus californianus TaxID=9704 RepID=A0A6J2BBV0_ZALCA|nr:meiotic recombination protein REC8 homolog isoform X1 [Zalophus californianus]XP_027428441.1 meiotic recombination protein REC8 homolog isoform X1 [Zalophus californianus]XP_035584193.1 meiotic recombination protein REC8 homolog isoform X1 [Zalophus californianus]